VLVALLPCSWLWWAWWVAVMPTASSAQQHCARRTPDKSNMLLPCRHDTPDQLLLLLLLLLLLHWIQLH